MNDTVKPAVLITGAAVRIGKAIALALASDGHPIAIHYNSSRAKAEETVDELRALGVAAEAVQADLANHDDVMGLVPAAAAALGQPIGVLINNASLFENDRMKTATQESFDSHVAINLRAPLFLSQQFAAQLPEGAKGSVVNLIDMRVWKPLPGFISYTVSKAGLEMLTKTMAMALSPDIRVNAIGPGPVLPNERQSEEQFWQQWQSTALKRGAHPEEIADGVRFLIASPSVTGQMIAMDGGQHLPWPPISAETADLDG